MHGNRILRLCCIRALYWKRRRRGMENEEGLEEEEWEDKKEGEEEEE